MPKIRRRIRGWRSINAGISLIEREIMFLSELARQVSKERGSHVPRSQIVREILAEFLGKQWTDLSRKPPSIDEEPGTNRPEAIADPVDPASSVEKPGMEHVALEN